MSYAIIRNQKLTRAKSIGAYSHNERKTKNHTNKNIDSTKTHLNYYLKKNELSYIKEFDRIKEKYDLKGQIKVTSNILCEMVFTSDQKYFDEIGLEETKRYFKESYEFICKYKNLGEQNIISAVVHLDEDAPHMHLLFIPVVHTKDKVGNKIDKISCRDFWKGKNSYRDLQDKFFRYISSKGFALERGKLVEVTERKHYSMEEYKQITNYENTKKILHETKLDLPEVPNISDFKKFVIGRDEKIINEIIKPKDELIEELYQDKVTLHKELSKQAKVIEKATEYEKEKDSLLAHNLQLENKCQQLEENFEDKTIELKRELNKKYYKLEKENRQLRRIVNTVKDTIHKFISWVCKKFSVSVESVVRDFEYENHIYLDPIEQIKHEDRQKDNELEI